MEYEKDEKIVIDCQKFSSPEWIFICQQFHISPFRCKKITIPKVTYELDVN